MEANELAQASFGATMLMAIGQVYRLQGEIAGSNMFSGFVANMRQRGLTAKTNFSAVMVAIKVGHAELHGLCRERISALKVAHA